MAKVGAVIYEYYKNAFDGRCEKYTFKACEFDSRQAKLTNNQKNERKQLDKSMNNLAFFSVL